MVEVLYIDGEYPLQKDINEAAAHFDRGQIVAFPTDTVYALGCSLYNKEGIERILKVTGKEEKKTRLSVLVKDIKSIAAFVLPYSTQVFRALKEYSPGPCTFILNANNHLGKFFKSSKKEIGVRIPSHPVTSGLLQNTKEAIISTSIPIPEGLDPRDTASYILDTYKHNIDVLIYSEVEPPVESTILDCTTEEMVIVREGKLKIS
ncbi:MAG: threonylcarbamoyl-AMP synthase [Saprospiraceae bacterium]|nr:threonylcarbamoyl-AMP synthase [Saprospiraceae bacterium]MBK8109085.1 threonylcarbamoyl-AMP synthase [Saprospiraceae bacterium]MBK9686888.1 threonylcarbamoyl-AMP synthase [Saprospiraceae bacterium]